MLDEEKIDLKQTGKFIANKRKEHNLTQIELSKQLNVSERTISKWERGKSFPAPSLILQLCGLLGVSANELVNGKKNEGKEYLAQSDQQIIELLEERANNKKRLICGELIVGILLLISLTSMILVNFFNIEQWLTITIICLSFIVLFISVIIGCKLDIECGTFECNHCHKRFKPSFSSYFWAVHTSTTRHLKCPYCGKKSFCKKRLTHEEIKKNN